MLKNAETKTDAGAEAGVHLLSLVAVVVAMGLIPGCAIRRFASTQSSLDHAVVAGIVIRPTEPFVGTIERMKRSIAPVVCVQPRADAEWQLLSVEGTAVFVAKDGSFITPRHVLNGITGSRQQPCPVSAIYVPEDGIWHVDTTSFRIHISPFIPNLCKTDTYLDLAYCSPLPGTLNAAGISPVIFEKTVPPDGTPVAFTGFPLSKQVPFTTLGAVASYSATDELGTSTVVVDKANWPGASGSPIYLTNGRVIGILLARGAGDGSGLTYGLTSRLVTRLLPEQGVTKR